MNLSTHRTEEGKIEDLTSILDTVDAIAMEEQDLTARKCPWVSAKESPPPPSMMCLLRSLGERRTFKKWKMEYIRNSRIFGFGG
ncbi:hypothetical protein V6N11_010119 [Hibiscus sabdariffa]|uniref:Uncharacterized protein n=1 Tax=Hibiscus sabdariffa TaxID=183260 RepID=A0ABR2PDP4_9ROSI